MTRRALISTDFTRLWFGQAVSQFGDLVSGTALMLWIGVVLLGGQPQAPVVSGAAILTAMLAALAAAPLAGVLADRWDARTVMLHSDLVRCVVTTALGLLLLLPADQLGVGVALTATFAALVVTAVAAVLFAPAKVILLGKLVPENQLARASSYNQTAYAVMSIAAPAAAGVLLFSIGIAGTLLVDAATFGVSWLSLRAIGPTAAGRRVGSSSTRPAVGILGSFVSGVRMAVGDRVIRGLLITIGLAMMGCGAMTALLVYFVRYNLRASGTWFGILESATAVGTIAGGLIFGRIAAERIGYRRIYGTMLLTFGALEVVYSRLESPLPAMVLSVGIGAALGALNAAYTPLLITLVPRAELGRVSSLINATSQVASLLSVAVFSGLVTAALQGSSSAEVLGVHFGPIDTVFAFCGVLCVVAGVLALREQEVRKRRSCRRRVLWRTARRSRVGTSPR